MSHGIRNASIVTGEHRTSMILLAVCVAFSVWLAGCTSTATPVQTTARTSSEQTLESRAYAETSRQLAQAQWTVIEKRGPRSRGTVTGTSDEQTVALPRTSQAPTTAPAAIQETLDESQLPVSIVELPGDQVKIIWALRNFGGPSVNSSREAATNRRQVVLTLPDLGPLSSVLSQMVGRAGSAIPMPRNNTMVVTCDQSMRQAVLRTLDNLDGPEQQVEITVRVFEVSHDFDYQQGARLMAKRIGDQSAQQGISTFDTQQFLQAVQNPRVGPFQGGVVSLMQVSADAGLSMEASFQLLTELGLINVVSSPRMVVGVGHSGYTLVGQEIPIQSMHILNNVSHTTTTYKPVGVQLHITTQAAGGGVIKLHIIATVSNIAGFAPLPTLTGGSENRPVLNPIIDAREAETQVNICDGNTLVISGLRMIRTVTRESKIPGLGDIPLLGEAFKNHRTQQQLTDLYFFVTPTLLDGSRGSL